MAERFLVLHHPQNPHKVERQEFSRKGIAVAYVRRRLPLDRALKVTLVGQIAGDVPGAIRDDETGQFWTTVQAWTYHSDGRVDMEGVR